MSDHAIAVEQALIHGVSSEGTGANGKPLRYTGGIRSFIPASRSTIFAGSGDTVLTFLDAVYPLFDFNSPAGDQRIAFCGNVFLNELNKIIQGNSNTQMQFGSVIKQWGMNLREYILPQGTLLLRTHPLFNRNTLYRSSALIMDFSQLRWRHTKGRDTHFQDNIQNNDEDTQKGQWFTEGGVEVFGGGLSMGYLGSLSAT